MENYKIIFYGGVSRSIILHPDKTFMVDPYHTDGIPFVRIEDWSGLGENECYNILCFSFAMNFASHIKSINEHMSRVLRELCQN